MNLFICSSTWSYAHHRQHRPRVLHLLALSQKMFHTHFNCTFKCCTILLLLRFVFFGQSLSSQSLSSLCTFVNILHYGFLHGTNLLNDTSVRSDNFTDFLYHRSKFEWMIDWLEDIINHHPRKCLTEWSHGSKHGALLPSVFALALALELGCECAVHRVVPNEIDNWHARA